MDMTKGQIMSMKPGRELDALVAEHVFGWRKIHGPKTDYDGPCESFDVLVPHAIDDPFPLYPMRGAIKPWFFCLYWSTDLSASWKIISLWEAKGYVWSMGRSVSQPKIVKVTVYTSDRWFNGEGDTVQEAICKAALLVRIKD